MKDMNHNFGQGVRCGLQSQIRAKILVVKDLEPRKDKKARTLPASTISVRSTPKIMAHTNLRSLWPLTLPFHPTPSMWSYCFSPRNL